ncbi:hypothetical protein PHMEG_00014784 [Phytophthora megakarya]|uniref:Uncharacterized protein n=1 Tax=Phytophthora megakarya TaxID=4795 RepID=A0A225W4Z1_9STRA|nr:hypothetical protein PHMEG_00014784 [Phytophthora megakarya]
MKLFLPNGWVLDKKVDNYTDSVNQIGDEAAAKLQAYLRENRFSSTGSSAILKALLQLHSHRAFNERIHLHAVGDVIDPSPAHYQATLIPTVQTQ